MNPLISCLCISCNYRASSLKRAIHLFQQQSYPNKELVILYLKDDLATKELVSCLHDDRILTVEIENRSAYSLGELRNLSIDKSRGEYICNWDDDDWYHPDRLKEQFEAIVKSGKAASILACWLMYDMKNKEAFISSFRPWEASIMCSKKVLQNDQIQYPAWSKGEDKPFISALAEKNMLFPLICPQLYIYIYNGNNLNNAEHFKRIFYDSQKLPAFQSEAIANILQAEVSDRQAIEVLRLPAFLSVLNYSKMNYNGFVIKEEESKILMLLKWLKKAVFFVASGFGHYQIYPFWSYFKRARKATS